MSCALDVLARLRRPRLLVSAARIGLADYDRSRDLKRLFRASELPSPSRALARLIDEEEQLERTRVSGDSAYSVSRHVEILIALMGEARIQPRAPGIT